MNIETTKIGCIGPRPLFAIVHYNRDNDENTYFAGFYNEVQCIGTEEESQCWENEEWVDNQDGAFFFNRKSTEVMMNWPFSSFLKMLSR